MPISNKIYPRTGDTQTVYLKNVITNPNIKIGDYTMYNDFVNDPKMKSPAAGYIPHILPSNHITAMAFHNK